MNEPSSTEESLRHFLLGAVDDAERERIESRFLIDPEYKDLLLATEQSLIDDYLEERLPAQDKESFLLQYAGSPDQLQKLRIAKLIKEYAEAHSVVRPIDSKPKWWYVEPKLFLRIAAVVVIALLLIVWIQFRRSKPDARHLAIERELASLNDSSSQAETLPGTLPLSVAPITLRDLEPQARFTPRQDIRILELHLLSVSNERSAKYRAVLSRSADSEQFNFPVLSASTDNPQVIRLRVPTSVLTPGDYQIHLSSIAADGSVSSVEEYRFRVSG